MSINNFFDKNLRLIFLLIILAEILSFLGYFFPAVNYITFFIIVFLAVILSLYNLKYGLWILLAELFIGSFGYLFYFEAGGFKLSLRIALWLIIMSVWLAKTMLEWIKTKKLSIIFFKSSYFSYFFILFIFIAWGLINGLLNHNYLNNLFFDFDRWLYWLLIFPIWQIFSDNNNLKILKQIFLTGLTWLSLKTIILAYFFSHNFSYFTLDLYRWVRLSGAGEITQVVPGFSRVFMQSHIYVLIGFFILLFYLLKDLVVIARSPEESGRRSNLTNNTSSSKVAISGIASLLLVARNDRVKLLTLYFILLTLFLSTILISFSRSFWIGLAAGAIFISLTAIFKLKIKLKKIVIFNLIVTAVIILSFILTFFIIKFPYPAPSGGFDATNLLSDRATAVANEAGASSRWQLLPPLWQKIKTAPILGQGFGATVTYESDDPRVLAANSKGEYTTYAFEWGWLDVWLKLGLFGLLAYLALFAKIIFNGLKTGGYLSLALAASLAVLFAVNIFSPYVNHPLGIGYIILAAAIIGNLKNRLSLRA